MRVVYLLWCLGWAVLMCSAAAQAVDVDTHLHDAAHTETVFNYVDDTWSGDWAGARTRWATAGVSVNLALQADLFRHRGGLRSGGKAMYHLEAEVAADFERLYGWQGLAGHLQLVDDRGGRVNERAVGSVMGVSNLEVAPAATRVLHAWVQHEALDGQLATLFGLYPVDSEFSVIESAAMFSHPAYGPPADLSLTNKPSVFPVSAVGLRILVQPREGASYAQWAVLDGVPDDPNTEIRLKKDDGVFGIAEWGRRWPAPQDGGILGKLAVGGWGYSTRAADLLDSTVQRRRYGVYLLGEGAVWQDESRVLMGFFRYSGTDGRSTAIRRTLNVGVRLAAPFANRPADAFGVAFTRGQVSEHYRQAQGISVGHEDAWEMGYRAQVTPWLVLQPLAQRVRHPAAGSSSRDSTVLGVRIEAIL